jgi:malate dehydrogenase (oxaloacetate-decarboxylating)
MNMLQRNQLGGQHIILRLQMSTDRLLFGQLINQIAHNGGHIIGMDMVETGADHMIRDITIAVEDTETIDRITDSINGTQGVKLVHVSDRTFLLHIGGKLRMEPKTPIMNRDDLSRMYTPEVARICKAIHEEPEKVYSLTIKRNTVAVISDGTAVLGLGNIGPAAAMPVMEGKAVLFKQFANVDAFPICLDTQDTEEIIRTVKQIAPAFGGINLEDISSPRCFEIEERLKKELDIPVFHDDQHGTAVVMYAGLLNALRLTGRRLDNIRVVVSGVGAAGIACSKLLLSAGVKNIIGVDRTGILNRQRNYHGNPMKQWFAENTNPFGLSGTLRDALAGADVFIGLSSGGILTRQDILTMAPRPIVFAMANPVPEIAPEEIDDIAGVVATGRSDYPNQINNVLCFPGVFRGALDCRATDINEAMKLASARAIASIIPDRELNRHYIIPSVFNQEVVKAVSDAVIRAAIETGVARKIPKEYRN